MNLKGTLKKHLSIEYSCNSMLNEGLLLENYGLFNGAKDIADQIITDADMRVRGGEKYFTIDNLETEMGKLELDFLVTIVDFDKKRVGRGGYKSGESVFNKKTGKLEDIEFIFKVQLYPNESFEHYRPLFYHELTHVYEDWQRRRKNKESIRQHNKRNNYYTNDFTTDYKTIWTSVKRIIYFLTDTEERAYIAMVKGILKKNKHLYTAQQCYDEIKSTRPYLFYEEVEKYIQNVKECCNKKEQERIVEYFQNHGYEKIKTFNGLCNAIEKRFFNFKEKLGKTTGKIIFEYLEDIKNNTTDWGIEF